MNGQHAWSVSTMQRHRRTVDRFQRLVGTHAAISTLRIRPEPRYIDGRPERRRLRRNGLFYSDLDARKKSRQVQQNPRKPEQILTMCRLDMRFSRIKSWIVYIIAIWIGATMMPLIAVDALTQQTQIIARCLGWANNTCAFSPLEPVEFAGLNLTQQTVCKADLSVAVMQIDWESPAGGRGSVDSLLVNGFEMLQAPVHPSRAYLMVNYPHCSDMFNIFPPWRNGIIGPEGRTSIIPEITSSELLLSIHFSWKGSHEVHPMCSMMGVSIAGYAEINVYLEAQDDNRNFARFNC